MGSHVARDARGDAVNAASAELSAHAVVRLEGVRYAWKEAEGDIIDVNRFEVARGERLFVAGPSGSGKSTLLSLLGGVITPREGRVEVLQTELSQLAGRQRDRFRADHVGIVFQMFNLVPYLSMVGNVTLPCRFSVRRRQRAKARSAHVDAEARRLLADLELDAPALHARPVTHLSIGQQQRVAVARALVGSPELVIADEPTSALDEGTRERFLALLFDECSAEGTTLLFVSHDTRLGTLFNRRQRLGYSLGDKIIIAHSAGDVGFVNHDDKPFRVVCILERTGTPVDRTVHVSLAGIEAMHIDWQAGARIPGLHISAEEARGMDLTPKAITAFLVGLNSKIAVFGLQREINEYREEPLLAIIPGVALQQLWDLMRVAENALRIISATVVVTGLLCMLTVILSSLDARRREMAVLRSVGARPLHVFALFMSEAGLLALIGVACGVLLLYGVVLSGRPVAAQLFGLYLPIEPLHARDVIILGGVVLAGVAAGSVPAFRAYRLSLADGLHMRI